MLIDALRSELADGSSPVISGLDEIAELRELLDRAEARWLDAVAESARIGEAERTSACSMTDWLSDRCRRTRGEARASLTFARRLATAPECHARLRDGRLSLEQAHLIVSVRTARTAELFDAQEDFLAGLATGLCTDDLAIAMRQWYRRADAATAHRDDTDTEERRNLHLALVGTTEWALQATLTAAQGDTVADALNAITTADHDGDEETRTAAQRRADVLATIARFWLDHQQTTTVHRHRPHVIVHIDLDDLANDTLTNVWTPSGAILDAATTGRSLCEAMITRIVTSGSEVLDVGRTASSIPNAIRRAVIHRDRHCRYPGCSRPASWCDVHHIIEQANGGHHAITNCLLLCGRHHHRLHRNHETVRLDPDGTVTVTTSTGERSTSPPTPDRFRPRTETRAPDPGRRACDHARIRAALLDVQRAASWTDHDHDSHSSDSTAMIASGAPGPVPPRRLPI